FTPSNALIPQTVTVTGVADTLTDGNVAFRVVMTAPVSSDSDYSSLNSTVENAINLDVLPKGTRTYTDKDGDTYTIKLTGPGTVAALIASGSGNSPGPIDQIIVAGTDPALSR